MLSSDFKTLAEDKKFQIAETIHVSSDRIYKLLENLLQWAGTQTGNIPFNPEVFDLSDIIDLNHDLVRDLLVEKRTSLVKKSPDHVVAFADRNMVNTVLRNLLGNAIKFTEDGEICISVVTKNHHHEITIADSGVGIPYSRLINIFEIDQVRSTGGTRGEKGSGLGLLICKEFIQRNGGEISVKSTVGKGTSFTFTLPGH
jgi:signal transduction histidine kinase